MEERDKEIESLKKKVRKLEAALRIVTNHSVRGENLMRKQFAVVSETIPVPMIITNNTGDVLFANQNALMRFGYSFKQFSQINALSLYSNPNERELFMEILSRKGEVEGFRLDIRNAEGSVFPAMLFSKQINFEGQNAILTVVNDLSQVIALEKQLRHSQKMQSIGTLAGGIAHDFNNILGAIFGYTELIKHQLDIEKNLEQSNTSDDSVCEQKYSRILDYMDKIQIAGNRAKSMITQMMTFCRQSEKEKKAFNISSVVSEVVKMMKDLTPSNIQIKSHIMDKNLMIMGDPTQIHQVLINLITNSVYELSNKGGEIEVVLQKIEREKIKQTDIPISTIKDEASEYTQITVKDDGPGIAKEILHRIFDPFFTTKPVGQGSGMGLSVVHGIITGHNGHIRVESEKGKGVTFHCYFPAIAESEANMILGSKSNQIVKGNETILLVDDDPMIIDVCSELLNNLGYNLTSCDNSIEALEIFKQLPEKFDLVITDNTMPKMDGVELIMEIHKIRADIPTIMMTGNLLIKQSDLKPKGIESFIQKPFDLNNLQLQIREVLDKNRGI